MRHRVLSLALAGLVILATTASAFAQVTVTQPFNTAGVSANGRVDTIVGFTQSQGVPSVASGTFAVQVKAADPQSAAFGQTIVPYIQDLDAFFAKTYGWRSSMPVTVVLYSGKNGAGIGGLTGFIGRPLTVGEQTLAASQPAFLIMNNTSATPSSTSGWTIIVNTDIDTAAGQFADLAGQMNSVNMSLVPSSSPSTFVISPSTFSTATISEAQTFSNAMTMIQESLANQYTTLMIVDLSDNNAPQWFQQGLANSVAFTIVPGFPAEIGWSTAVSRSVANNATIPTVAGLGSSFPTFISTGGTTAAVAQGISFLTARSLLDTLGSQNLMNFLKSIGSGTSFESALSSFTGLSVDQLASQTRSLVPPTP